LLLLLLLLPPQVSLCSSLTPGKVRPGKVNELFVYDNFSRVPVEEVQAGDICAMTGISDIGVRGNPVNPFIMQNANNANAV
jgi:predicted membrane GTPase involved in stress response